MHRRRLFPSKRLTQIIEDTITAKQDIPVETKTVEMEEVEVAELPVQPIPKTVENAEPEEALFIEENIEPAHGESYLKTPSNIIRVWQAKKGANLQKILSDWSMQENVKFSWNTKQKYRLSKDIFISGTFENAINVLFSKGLETPPDHKLEKETGYELIITHRPQ